MTRRAAVTRRRALLGLAGAAVVCGACSSNDPRPDLVGFPFRDDLTDAPDGPLDGRVSAGGYRWRATGAARDQPPIVSDGAFGPPPGHVPGRPDGEAAAGYATVELATTVRRVGAEFRWDRSRATKTAIGIGAFTWPGTDLAIDRGARAGSNMHLAIRPAEIQFAVFSDRGDYTTLVPDGGGDITVPLDPPMSCDGDSVYRTDLVIDGDGCRVTVNGQSWTFRDPRVASVPARFPFFEYYSRPGGTNLPRFLRVWGA